MIRNIETGTKSRKTPAGGDGDTLSLMPQQPPTNNSTQYIKARGGQRRHADGSTTPKINTYTDTRH